MGYLGMFEETRELRHAINVINSIIRKSDSMVRLVYKDNTEFSVKLDKEIDLVIADFTNMEVS